MRDSLDPKGLVREAFCIEGITPGECRSIFLDWALSVDGSEDMRALISGLIERYDGQGPHPMMQVLQEGLENAKAPKRRGGWRARAR